MSGGRIGSTPFGQKMQEITNKVESGANFIAKNEGKAQESNSDSLQKGAKANSAQERGKEKSIRE